MLAAIALTASACGDDDGSSESGEPIRVGSTLSLTGPFAPTGAIHRLAGELFVERLNRGDRLLGQRVEWSAWTTSLTRPESRRSTSG
jgi:branched-chain amino acid transport system substrate-binding protein